MQAQELVELAALVATHSRVLISRPSHLSRTGLEDYWAASKCRLDSWGRDLRKYSLESDKQGEGWARDHWPNVLPVLEEVLTSEILTRVWTAVVVAYDQGPGSRTAEPIARRILVGHLEARNRVLRLIHRGSCFGRKEATVLNRTRRRCERWADLYIGYLLTAHDVAEFAIDADRACEFADDFQSEEREGVGLQARTLALGSLRRSFPPGAVAPSPNYDLNVRIAASVINCFPADVFDSTGLFRSVWLARIHRTANDAQELLDGLLNPGCEPAEQLGD